MATFESPGGVPRGGKVNMVWTRTGEDVATIGMHFLHRDGDTGVADFTDADAADVEGMLSTLWGALKGFYGTDIALDRYEWHRFGVDVRRPNPRFRETLLTPVAGDGGDAVTDLPPQVACSVTFKTSARRTWGRVYLPNMLMDNVDTGRFKAATVAAVRTAFGNLLDAAAGASLPLVVWSPRHDGRSLQYDPKGTPFPGPIHLAGGDNPDSSSFARTVDQVQVDDLADVIRRRRYDRANVKDTHTIGA